MKYISLYLNEFIKDEFIINKSNLFSKIPKLSQSSIQFIKEFIDKLYNAHNEWDNMVLSNSIKQKDILLTDKLPKGENYNFIPLFARTYLENYENKKMGKIFNFSILNDNSKLQNVTIHIIYPFNENDNIQLISKEKTDLFFKECCYKIFLWLFVSNKMKNDICSQKINIYLYLTDLFKLLPTYSNHSNEDNNIIDVIHANTAFTSSCKNTTEINLFREEEWFKVFIHETFHCLGLDFSHYNEIVNISKDRILSLFHINSDIKLYETYCEMGAELINIIFYLFLMETKHKHKSISLENIIKNEQIFSIFQSCKVLSQLEMNYEDLFEDREHHDKYKENTNVFSYYIIKSILIFHLEDYIQFIINKNNKSFNFVNNKIKNEEIDHFKQQNINDFCDLIEKNYKNKNYLECINYMDEWMRFHKKSKRFSKSLEYNTLKMTILEIE
jgi:hypothetical protein